MKLSHKKNNIKISKNQNKLTDEQIQRMTDIVTHYFPKPELIEEMLRSHLAHANTVCLAWHQNRIIGFSIASKYKKITPFYPRPIDVLYQRMLYLEPDALYRGVGLRLLSTSLRDLFGILWPCKRFVTICRTQNPVVVKMMNMYDKTYPQYGHTLPATVRQFIEGLLPMLHANKIDEQCRLVGTLDEFKGMDYTDIWNSYMHSHTGKHEEHMLHTAFKKENNKIVNTGAFVLMIGYAKPFTFISYLFH